MKGTKAPPHRMWTRGGEKPWAQLGQQADLVVASVDRGAASSLASAFITIDARTQVHQTRPFQRPGCSLKADWLDELSTSNGAFWITGDDILPADTTGGEEVVAPPPDRPLHHPRDLNQAPGIYNAVLRSEPRNTKCACGRSLKVCIARLAGGGAEKRNLLAPSPWCCKQRRATTTYRLPPPFGTPPLLNV